MKAPSRLLKKSGSGMDMGPAGGEGGRISKTEVRNAGTAGAAGIDAGVRGRGDADPGRAPNPGDPADGRRRAGRVVAAVRPDVRRRGPAIDPTGAALESVAVDGAVLGAFRARLLRAARLQPALPLVPGDRAHRAAFRPLNLLEEPRPGVSPPCRTGVL